MHYRVYDNEGDYYPTVEADNVDITDSGVNFYNKDGALVAHFDRNFFSGFCEAPEEPEPTGRWWKRVKLLYTCPDCGKCCPVEDAGSYRVICDNCGRELGEA